MTGEASRVRETVHTVKKERVISKEIAAKNNAIYAALIPRRERTARAPVSSTDIAIRRDFNGIRRAVGRCRHDIMATLCQGLEHFGRKSRLDVDLVRLPLVVKTGSADGLVDRHMKVDCVHDDLQH